MSNPRIGLVLGAGGVLGGAWLVGALHAIASETEWDPAGADYIVGTSAGSMVGALLACGVSPEFMVARSTEGPTARGMHAGGARQTAGRRTGGGRTDGRRIGGAAYRLDRAGLTLGPGSWRLAAASLARPRHYTPAAVVSGWLPRGLVSTEPLERTIRRACPDGAWAPHPNYWAMAVDYGTGRRVAFGRPGAPEAELPDAVAASCAIPGFYRPVEIGGRTYVDGGVYSLSNLDILRDEPLDLVIALNPVSSLDLEPPRGVSERLAFRVRQTAGRRLGSEAKRLRAAGIEVVMIQPSAQDLTAMGTNLMNRRRRREVTETAVRTVTEQLRETPAGERLAAAA